MWNPNIKFPSLKPGSDSVQPGEPEQASGAPRPEGHRSQHEAIGGDGQDPQVRDAAETEGRHGRRVAQRTRTRSR